MNILLTQVGHKTKHGDVNCPPSYVPVFSHPVVLQVNYGIYLTVSELQATEVEEKSDKVDLGEQ